MDHQVCNMCGADDGADGLWTCRHVSLGISVRWWLEMASNKSTYCGEASLGSTLNLYQTLQIRDSTIA